MGSRGAVFATDVMASYRFWGKGEADGSLLIGISKKLGVVIR
jgi:hypothetical protein